MANPHNGYSATPEDDRRRGQAVFDRADEVARTGAYDYAIEMYLQGLSIDPENVDAHQRLREISLKRKASGGKDLGMFETMKVKTNTSDEKANMLAAEKLLAYDPGNTARMLSLAQSAHKAGLVDAARWAEALAVRANAEKP